MSLSRLLFVVVLCTFAVPAFGQSANDDCANAIAIGEGSVAFDNTLDTTGAVQCQAEIVNDVWYLYTASVDGTVAISTCNSIGITDTIIAVYDGTGGVGACPMPGDVAIACVDDSCGPFLSEVVIPVTVGQEFLIQVSGWQGAGAPMLGAGTLDITQLEVNCADGIDDDGDGLTDCADPECDADPACIEDCTDGIDNDGNGFVDCNDLDCDGDPACAGVILPPTGSVCTDTGTTVDSVWTPSVGGDFQNIFVNGVLVAANEPMTTSSWSEPYAAGFSGTIEICVETLYGQVLSAQDCCSTPVNPPMNDDCSTPDVAMSGVQVTGNLSAATNDGTSSCGGTAVQTNPDVWYSFTAPGDSTYNFSTCGTNPLTGMDTVIAVFDACGGTELACNDDNGGACPAGSGGLDSFIQLAMTTGQTVVVRVSHFGTSLGTGEFLFQVTELENCTDGIDNNGDGFVDCDDLDCAGDVTCVYDPPTGSACVDSGTSVDSTWTPSVGGDFQNIFVDGVLVAPNEPMSTTTFSAPYAAGFVGTIEICVETVYGEVSSAQDCCSLTFGGPANDLCVDAIPIALGDTMFDNALAGTDGPAIAPGCSTFAGASIGADIWYEYTATFTGNLNVSTCNSAGSLADTVIQAFDAALGCPAPTDIALACADDDCGTGFLTNLDVPVVAGETYLIQLGGFGGQEGTGTVTLTEGCGTLGAATCAYDINTGTVTVSWTDNANATMGYEILENGVSVGTAPAGSSSFQVLTPAVGTNTYDVTWTCAVTAAAGDPVSCTADVVEQIPAGTTDVILHLEGLDDAGDLGLVDSGAALSAALTANGSTVHVLVANDFDLVGFDFSIPDRIWVLTGSFPNDTRLTLGELDLLAAQAAAGKGIYLEGGDHWGFTHVDSLLDGRDGIEEDIGDNILDGDDTFTAMDGAAAPLAGADLSALMMVAYTQDQAGNDFTDVLSLTGTDPMAVGDPDVVSAEALFTNSNDGLPDPADPDEAIAYITSVVAVHNDGGVMISSSWEFGGFGGDQNALAADYLGLLGGGVMPGVLFARGDINDDGARNIADAIFGLGILFPQPGSPPNVPNCAASADVNDDGGVNIADMVFLLSTLFPPPGMPPTVIPDPATCGTDPTMDTLTCDSFTNCP